MATLTSLLTSVKSVQRGIVNSTANSGNITIAAVNMSKTVIIASGGSFGSNGNSGFNSSSTGFNLTSSTNIAWYANRQVTNDGCNACWQAIEYY